jgi:hypothetical protein
MMIKRDMALDNLIKVCQETLQIIGDMVEADGVAYSRGYEDGMAAEAQVQKTLKPWVGLTDEEAYEIYNLAQEKVNGHWESGGTTMMFPSTLYKAIEAKLKEKNT